MSKRDDAPDSAPVSARAWFTLAILVLMLVLSYLDRGLIALLVKPIKESFQVSDVQIGLLYGMAFGLFYAFFSFPLGWLADRDVTTDAGLEEFIGWLRTFRPEGEQPDPAG